MKLKALVTAADLAQEALALLTDFEVVFAGKTPTAADITALCKQHNPVAIIVRYGRMDAPQMDAAPLTSDPRPAYSTIAFPNSLSRACLCL